MPKISVIIPCYFNEGNIPITAAVLLQNEKNFSSDITFEYVFVDDGSGDKTLEELIRFHQSNPKKTKVISLTENVGSYNALCAGFEYATGDCLVVMSADLQDPPEVMVEMYQKWSKGSKVVLAVRQRRSDPFLTKLFAALFHSALRFSGLANMPKGGFDYCLFDYSLVQMLNTQMVSGINVLLLLLQFDRTPSMVYYERRNREIGKSQWTFSKKLKLALKTLLFFLLKKPKQTTNLYFVKETYGV